MKAVILAAGESTRLRPLTNDRPKCMVEFQGKEIIDHILDTMRNCGLEDIAIVKGYCAHMLNKEGTKTYTNKRFDETNMVSTFFCSEEYWDDDIIISYADIVYTPEVLDALMKETAEISVVVDEDWRNQWEKRMDNPLDDAETLKLNGNGCILELGKKPKSYDEIQGQYIGLIKMRKSILPKIKELYESLDRKAQYDGKDFDNMFMTSFIQLIIDQLNSVKAVFIQGGWVEIDTLDDLRNMEAYMAEDLL